MDLRMVFYSSYKYDLGAAQKRASVSEKSCCPVLIDGGWTNTVFVFLFFFFSEVGVINCWCRVLMVWFM